jgi:predicted membrane-bound spermidine synthase
VDVVEINAAVVPVAEHFFDLHPEKINITIDDGRHFLNRCTNRYDAVILDAFLGDSSPAHLMSRQAFESIRRVLRPGGVLVINSFGDLEDGRDFFTASLNKTLKAVFQSVRLHSSGDGAMFFAAGNRPDMAFVNPPNLQGVHPDVVFEAKTTYAQTVQPIPGHGLVLTDNFNPAEYYDARNREELRRSLAKRAREM